MDARRAGVIGGGAAFAIVAALASTFAVSHALTIEDQSGIAVNTPPVVVSTTNIAPPTATPTAEPSTAPVEVAAPPAVVPPVEVVTVPKPKPVAPAAPVAPAQPVVPETPAQVAPSADTPWHERPEWPSDGNGKGWTKFGSFDEAAAWANEQGWTEQRVRNWLHEYADRRGWKH